MIDLHCHTKVSDGSLTTYELVYLAKLRGISHLAITDHDTTLSFSNPPITESCWELKSFPELKFRRSMFDATKGPIFSVIPSIRDIRPLNNFAARSSKNAIKHR